MKLSRTNQILAAVLALQVVVAIVLYAAGAAASNAAPAGTALLPDFNPDNLAQITIRDADKNELVMARDDLGAWVLPNAGNFPVETFRVTTLLNGVRSLNTNRLIAQSASNHSRLKVADDEFERYVEFKHKDGRIDRLYVGASSGGNTLYARVNDQAQVYLVSGISTFEIATRAAQWIDTVYFTVQQADIALLRIENANGTFEFRKENGNWVYTGLQAGQVFNADSLTPLLSQIASVNIDAPLSQQAEDRFGLAQPLATITVVTRRAIQPTATPTGGPGAGLAGTLIPNQPTPVPQFEETTHTLQIGAKINETAYVVKSPQSPFYVQVLSGTAEQFINLTNDMLLTAPTPTPTPSATPTVAPTSEATAPATSEATSETTAEATTEPTAAATVAPTTEPTPEATAAPTQAQ